MSIKDELAAELTDAIKSGDARRRDVIRQVQTEVATARAHPDFDGEAGDSLYESVIASYVKKMDKSRAEYEGYGDRGAEMAAKLSFEVEYLSRWLPQKLDERETKELIEEMIAQLGVAGDEKAAGRVTGQLMQARGADLDGGLVNRLVREALSED